LSAFYPGEPDTTCQAFVGETVILPCNITSSGELDLSNSKLYWQKESVLVHFFHNGADSLDYQDMNYHDRTSLFLDEVKHGNFSLQLSNVRLDDTAVYTCIYKQSRTPSWKTQKSRIKLYVSATVYSKAFSVFNLSGPGKASPRSPGDAQGLDPLTFSFHLLVTLVVWHL
ncbi:VTCN1 inhibitor, partial [Nothoprocta ornata]|nr:VTCN1 inhibitor [Nothoprocta pentlandii]NWY00213.1 VTCN1 inhibitor [Nothoprocta ornata]